MTVKLPGSNMIIKEMERVRPDYAQQPTAMQVARVRGAILRLLAGDQAEDDDAEMTPEEEAADAGRIDCSCGGTLAPVEAHVLDLSKPCPPEHPCIEVAYTDGVVHYYDVIQGWSIDASLGGIKVGNIIRGGAVIPSAGNVRHIRLHKRGEH